MKAVNERKEIAGDVIPAFFESIAGTHLEVPETISGSLKFDVKEGSTSESWRVTFSQGVVSSARSNEPADCLLHTDKSTLEGIIQGRINAMAALLRGALTVEGAILLPAVFRSLFSKQATEGKQGR